MVKNENSRIRASSCGNDDGGFVEAEEPGPDFERPDAVLFVADDRSIYKGLHPEAWGVQFRVNHWSRAYTQFDLPSPSKIGRALVVFVDAGGQSAGIGRCRKRRM